MKKEMCEQLTILKKIRKKGKVNGYDVDLAEAQAKDYMSMKHRLDQIESTVDSIQKKQIEQDAKFDLIIQRCTAPDRMREQPRRADPRRTLWEQPTARRTSSMQSLHRRRRAQPEPLRKGRRTLLHPQP